MFIPIFFESSTSSYLNELWEFHSVDGIDSPWIELAKKLQLQEIKNNQKKHNFRIIFYLKSWYYKFRSLYRNFMVGMGITMNAAVIALWSLFKSKREFQGIKTLSCFIGPTSSIQCIFSDFQYMVRRYWSAQQWWLIQEQDHIVNVWNYRKEPQYPFRELCNLRIIMHHLPTTPPSTLVLIYGNDWTSFTLFYKALVLFLREKNLSHQPFTYLSPRCVLTDRIIAQ